ncbi:MAG: hypothetical protein RIC35_12265 [Marinoscillum sp.]
MKKLIVLIALMAISASTYSQDIIVRDNGDKIECKVTKVDSMIVYFDVIKNGVEISTTLAKSQIAEILYESPKNVTSPSSIIMRKEFVGYQFYQEEKRLGVKQLLEAVRSNYQAYQQIQSAQSIHSLAVILSSAGGFMVGWPIGTAVGGGDPNWKLAAVGAGFLAASIPISLTFNKKVRKAVNIYNSGLQTSTFKKKSEFKLLVGANTVGLTLKF